MLAPDLQDELQRLREAGAETGAAIDRVSRQLSARRPRSVKDLHDTKAHLTYLRLMLRTVQQELASLERP
ncbi:MAG TPA: hypothetical protein VFX49_05850 [Chloroflexota bacterium]|nr:hypothetical protein [Chloroflexota bacterium]